MTRLVLALGSALAVSLALAQNTTRKIRPSNTVVPVAVSVIGEPVSDTVAAPASDSVAVSGFEKMLKSRRETFLVSNRMSRGITSVDLTITYKDMKGRMLHRAVHTVAVDIPSGETRSVSVPSWDLQGVMYYCRSAKPSRASQATPFDVNISVNFVTIGKANIKDNENCHNSSNGQGAGSVAPSYRE